MCPVVQSCPTFVAPWTPLSLEFSKQEFWNGLPGAAQVAPMVKNWSVKAGDARDMGLISGLERLPTGNVLFAIEFLPTNTNISPGVENCNPLQYSCLEDSMDRRAWGATVRGVEKSRTQLSIHRHTVLTPILFFAWIIVVIMECTLFLFSLKLCHWKIHQNLPIINSDVEFLSKVKERKEENFHYFCRKRKNLWWYFVLFFTLQKREKLLRSNISWLWFYIYKYIYTYGGVCVFK